MRSRLRSLLITVCALALGLSSHSSHAPAQVTGDPSDEESELGPIYGAPTPPVAGLEGGDVGYEVALSLPTSLTRGRVETLAGVAFEVAGVDDLRRTRGLDVEVALIARTPRPAEDVPSEGAPRAMPFRLVERATVSSGAAGIFSIALSVPDEALDQPTLVVRVGRPGAPARRWVSSVTLRTDLSVDLLTDRVLYEAGETLHAWVRLREGESHRPVAHRALVLRATGAEGVIDERPLVTVESGAASAALALPASLAEGPLSIALYEGTTHLATRSVVVGARHLERMRVDVGLDRTLLGPGETLSGTVQVIGADSTPVEGAEVSLESNAGEGGAVLVTDASGQIRFGLPTASYLSGDSASYTLSVRVSHPAHGSAVASERYTITRTPYFVTVMPEGGALPLEVEADLYVQVANALGEASPAGLTVEVAGASVVGRTARTTTDAHGLGRVRLNVPRTAAAVSDGGACSGRSATEIVVSVLRSDGRPARDARLCVPVAPSVRVVPHVDRVVAAPGQRIDVTLLRSGPRHPVLVTLFQDTRARAHAFVDANESHARFDLPLRAQGQWTVAADPILDEDARAPVDAWGATFAGTGGSTSFVVRPDDAFSLALSTDAARYPVRGTVHASLATSVAPSERAWATFLMRDESWHAGEMDYALYSWTADLRDAIQRPSAENELMLRYAFAASLSEALEVRGETPVIVEPWNSDAVYAHAPQPRLTFDPVHEREVLRRNAYAQHGTELETFLSSIPEYDAETVRGIVVTSGGRTHFADDAFERLGELGLSAGPPIGLGGVPLTPADLERANIGFSFEVAAARVARMRLVTLLGALATVSSTADAEVARLFAVEPPERWLALAAHYGFVDANLLLDPWGRPFVFRDAGARGPAIVISERAANWELVSAGADGRYGTGDDVRDPFARAVPYATIYAERSGENDLIDALSTIAPGPGALTRMAAAYRELGLAAEDERVPSAVFAYASEAYDENMPADYLGVGDSFGYGGLGLSGAGMGGGGEGSGYGSGYGSLHGRTSSTPSVRVGSAAYFAASALSRVVREEFPATLRFVGEIPLDRQGRASLDVVLADAVTTYRLEAIAWTETGWTSSAITRVSVDQTIQIDAPIPERGHVGDAISVPVRIVNRGAVATTVRPVLTVEGEVALALSSLDEVVVPPSDGVALTLTVAATSVGSGSILIEAYAEDGERLDAVRRPIDVRADARPLTLHRDALLEGDGEVVLEVPSDALSGGGGEVRIWIARALFGELGVTGDEAMLLAWVSALQGEPVPAEAIASLRERIPADEEAPIGNSGMLGTLLGGLYASPELDDASAARILRQLSAELTNGAVSEPLGALLGLSAAARNRSARPSLDGLLSEVLDALRELAATEGARATEAPETWARVAAALALTGDPDDEARIDEMLRRVERHVIRLNREARAIAWLEPDEDDETSFEVRARPTALLALALIGRGRAPDALPLLRGLADMHESAVGWPSAHRALAMAAIGLAMRARGATTEALRFTLDGVPLEANADTRSFAIPAEALSHAGTHTLRATLPEGMLVFVSLRSEHLVPWERTEPRTLPVELRWSGDVGPRDTRSALVLEVVNRSARVMTAPILDIQLPSGAELDVGARQLLARSGRLTTTEDGVHLALPPLRVGARLRIPLRIRSSLAGSLRGLGAVLRDARGEEERVAVLPSRALVIEESGPEPTFEDEGPASEPAPVPLPRDPLPMPLVESYRGL